LRIKEQETHLTLQEHDDDDDDIYLKLIADTYTPLNLQIENVKMEAKGLNMSHFNSFVGHGCIQN